MSSTSITNTVPSLPNPNFETFDGKDFPRWRGKMKFFLRRLKLAYVLEKLCPEAPSSKVAMDEATLIKEQIDKWQDDDYLCKNYILGGMSNKYYDQYYNKCKFAKEIWDTLKSIHLAEEVSSKKFLISNYMEFKMVDDKSITEQVQEFQLLANKMVISEIALDENFHVGVIVSNFLHLGRSTEANSYTRRKI
ncbi:hypothetical protein KY285_035444 [Solanum tuberosum]|nr:hypothetical protein KY285_035444 [Solanum tuberosum]